MDAALEIADAGLRRAIVIRIVGNAETSGPGDKCLADFVPPIEVGHRNVAVAAPIEIVTFADPPLKPLEIGQEVGVAPTCVAALRPVVEIVSLTAVDDHAVDRLDPPTVRPTGVMTERPLTFGDGSVLNCQV